MKVNSQVARVTPSVLSLCGIITAAFTPASYSVASEAVEPNAAELVRAVRESENWLHRIDSLQFRVEGKWLRTPEGIAARRAELKRQDPNEKPDPQRDWSLRPSYGDSLEYTIDFVGQRLRIVENTPGRQYFLKIWDGRQTIR
ncbi:MAG: hypothetical protein JSW59_19145 [Phycisphaerales bacterium]|nr:MAG: hypothetical protein JSW59_19145 [Phycisphaerales bacterium]